VQLNKPIFLSLEVVMKNYCSVLFVVVFVLLGLPLLAQDSNILTNDEVIQLVKAGLSEDVVLNDVETRLAVNFDISTSKLILLKESGVSASIIKSMMNRKRGVPVASLVPTSASSNNGVVLQDRTRVSLAFVEDISSSTAKQNDTVKFVVAEDVLVNGTVLIAKGSEAVGHVTLAKSKGRWGKDGKLRITVDSVKAVDGNNVRLEALLGDDSSESGIGNKVAGAVGGLFKGKDIEFLSGSLINALVDGEKKIVLATNTAGL
jgi:hypothetical protein